ncbi:hypothetical protein DFH29DRAFT_1002835 [Suillus ampliporus]|nr:hypothetical protein DFH29DRAFT_1002835 [Suillus ampliporus]
MLLTFLQTINDVDDLEANLVMDLARARRDVFNAEKALADCVVREHEVMANLSKHKSNISKQKLAKADVGIGHMRIAFKKYGFSHHGPGRVCKNHWDAITSWSS